MADVDFEDFDGGFGTSWDEPTRGSRAARLINLAGATCSVALVVGLGIWGYKLAVRDVTGVPVIRALEGPMRVAPQNPGGEVAAHQGLAVNTVAAVGSAAPIADRLVLAPRPVELTFEDQPGLALAGAMPDAEAGVTPATVASAAEPVALSSTNSVAAATVPRADQPAPLLDEAPLLDQNAVALALAEALAEDPALSGDAEGMADAPAGATTATVRPRARPIEEAAPLALSQPAPTLAADVTEVDPTAIPAGTRLVQLGAFDTADQARAEWVKLGNQFGGLLAGKAMVVQAAESGGRSFFRLRAHGFADEDEARSFCTAMLEQNAACIPVEQR